MSKIFIPHELKTIEVDTEKNIFRICAVMAAPVYMPNNS